ncbi:MAG: DNA polymerase III subunit delta [Bacillaceae bacterium]|jgi:DNA polymerase-3 subunit delta|uniref:DNA polymerase III subunit delta n=1 Tax=Aeribacillus pallidus TaxID=33936 RepID=A0A161ZT01_9BACI|nr:MULTISPECIES: DNA polymerase III subunit delta [Aeribacillus]AXI40162.1 DNA polymerase III subunit delta [Bacillaceae bacterium ZC4]REJ21433.1 MAG: DNA polymerase III subunit delta [Bacillaceae bacterium]KZM54216.1 DNA polymerase III subunit delta [Aeribacillus pallidus]KZN96257.1 DNA polymerase III subunit delta [Aeribacillus pallidus]MDR9792145.1 DNA polymerase III subunit delta [Aeribacillus pallidus]
MIVDLWNSFKKKQFQSLYLFYGKESFLLNETIRKLLTEAISEDEREFNYSVYDMEETNIETAVEDGETMPFLGERRMVVVKNPYFLTSEKKKEKVEHNLKKLEQYVENPAPFTVFVFLLPHEKIDERKKLTKQIKKAATVVEMNSFSEEETVKWIKEKAEAENVAMEKEAIDELMEKTSGNLMIIDKEMEKLCAYVGSGNKLTAEMVKQLVARSLEQNVFDLIDAVVKKKTEEAFKIFYDLLKINEEPIKILSLLTQQFRLLYQVKQLSKSGYGQDRMASSLKVHPFRIKLALKQEKQFSASELQSIIKALAETDFEIKTGKKDRQLALEFLLLKLFQQEKKQSTSGIKA